TDPAGWRWEAHPGGWNLCRSGRPFLRHALEERAERRRNVMRAGRTIGCSLPAMPAQAVEDAVGQHHGSRRIAAADSRHCSGPHTVDEVLQLAGELVLSMTIDVQGFQVSAEELLFQPRASAGVQTIDLDSMAAPVSGGLNETQPPL